MARLVMSRLTRDAFIAASNEGHKALANAIVALEFRDRTSQDYYDEHGQFRGVRNFFNYDVTFADGSLGIASAYRSMSEELKVSIQKL